MNTQEKLDRLEINYDYLKEGNRSQCYALNGRIYNLVEQFVKVYYTYDD
ncbi:MAG: hypothetical protein IJH55_09975 [Romboutsia sp.]|nr:hypothetical protein [Romboutsia sp.]